MVIPAILLTLFASGICQNEVPTFGVITVTRHFGFGDDDT